MAAQALLVVSFGTSFEQTRKVTIEAIENDLAAAFPERKLYVAWTSKFIIAKLKRTTGSAPMNLAEALDAMAVDGITDVLVQPSHIMPAVEYQMVIDALTENRDRFETISLGAALLSSDADYAQVAAIIDGTFPKIDNGMVALMGHGTPDGPNDVYTHVQNELNKRGREDICIATVEGEPDEVFMMETVRAAKPAKVRLAPFMIVAGDHANNDLAGDEEDSWKSQLEAEGFGTEAILKGFGEYSAVRALFTQHAKEAKAL